MTSPAPRRSGLLLPALIGAAAASAVAERAPLDRHRPTGRVAEIGGTRIHYREAGEGPPILLLHGNGATLREMEISGLVARLQTGFRVIAPDRPGFGHTPRSRSAGWSPFAQATLMRAFLRHIGAERPIVIGHSWATLPVLAMALDDPGSVAGIVLMSGYHYHQHRPALYLARLLDLPVLRDVARHTLLSPIAQLTAPAFIRAAFAPQPVPSEFDAFPVSLSTRPSQAQASIADAATMADAARTMSPGYRHLDVPALVVAGDADHMVDTRLHSLRLHRDLPQSRLLIVPGAGHMVHHVAVDQVALAIRRFAREAVDYD